MRSADQLEAACAEVRRLNEDVLIGLAEERDEVRAERDSLRQQLKAAISDRDTVGAERERANAWCDRIKPEYERIQAERDSLRQQLEASKAGFVGEIESLCDEFATAIGMPDCASTTALANEARRLRALVEPDDTRDPPTEARRERLRLHEEVSVLRQQLEAARSEATLTHEALGAALDGDDKLEAAQGRLAELEEHADTWRTRSQQLAARVTETEAVIADLNDRLREAQRDAVAIRMDRDDLRGGLEAAQRRIRDGEGFHADTLAEFQRRVGELENSLTAKELVIAEQERALTSPKRYELFAERDALKSRVAELEAAPPSDDTINLVGKELESRVEGLYSALRDRETFIMTLSNKEHTLRAALRAILPVYRAAEAWLPERNDPYTRRGSEMRDAIRTAQWAITPKIAAVLAEVEKP